MPEIISRADAKARGLQRYFTGKPCKRGHFQRFASGGCVKCTEARKRTPKYASATAAYRVLHKDEMRRKDRERRRKHPLTPEQKERARARERARILSLDQIERKRLAHKKWQAQRQLIYRAAKQILATENVHVR